MTTEFAITAVLFITTLIALDYLVLLAQRNPARLPFFRLLAAAWARAQNGFRQGWGGVRQTWQAVGQRWQAQNELTAHSPVHSQPASDQAQTKSEASAPSRLDYEIPPPNGKTARVRIEAEVPPNTVLHIFISTDPESRASVHQAEITTRRPSLRLSLPNLRALYTVPAQQLAMGLFIIGLFTYLLTRLVGLTDFPIYFFGDEAIQTATAADLIRDGMRGPRGVFLPTYFQNGQYFNLSVSVYLQVIPQLLFGKSIFVTRAVSVLVTMLAAICVGLIMRDSFGAKRWWLATLLLSITPAWFLHSRTAFETVLFVSFYAAFLYFYLEYRLRKPERVYWAVVFAGLAFYSYSPGQLVLVVTGVLLFFSDLSYHWQQRATLLKAVGLLAVFALPYLRFRLTVDYSPLDHLRSLGSYWIQPTPLPEKLARFAAEYLRGLSPGYWFFDAPDMARHQMRGYGNLPSWFAPLLLTGAALSLWRWRSPAHRLLLLAALAAPSGAALAEIGITRVLVFVIPASLLTAIGLDWLLATIESVLKQAKPQKFSAANAGNLLSLLTFVPLVLINFAMLSDALRNGPTWYTDYGLYGMQYGAKQIYQETVVPALQQDPQAHFIITPSWANGGEHFVGFFVPPNLQPRVALGQVYDFINPEQPFTDKDYFVVTWLEYEKIKADAKFAHVNVRSIIPYPNGEPGFYILNIGLASNIAELLAAEDLAQRTPVEETIQWMGQTVRVRHSHLSGGRLQDVIDGDPYSLARGERDNPIVYEFFFSQPITASELVLTTGSMRNFDVVIRVYAVGEEIPVEYSNKFLDLPDDPTLTIPFENGPGQFDRISISVKDNNQGEVAQVHIREIVLR
ncbi:MAG: hypothetical protein Fur0016_13830 [Anaerolineales bacterium]